MSGANSSERLMFRLRLRLRETLKPSPTLLRRVHVASPAAAVLVGPDNRVGISNLNLCQNEASFLKTHHRVKNASSSISK